MYKGFHAGIGVGVLLFGLVALPQVVSAQDEPVLQSFFEGKQIVVRIDMPASADGVDLNLDETKEIDFEAYQKDLKRYGIAIHAGDASVVTMLKVKKDLIEFQVGGGGYGTFGDDTSTSANIKLLDKSEAEKVLERQIKDEKDRDSRRSLERKLEVMRDDRDRENQRLKNEREKIEEGKRQRIAQQRLQSGSRFNLRYSDRVPPRIKPEEIMAALAQYVDFEPRASTRSSPTETSESPLPRKGMLRSDAERLFGRPAERRERREGGVTMTTLVFEMPEHRISADFAENVLIRYTITSK